MLSATESKSIFLGPTFWYLGPTFCTGPTFWVQVRLLVRVRIGKVAHFESETALCEYISKYNCIYSFKYVFVHCSKCKYNYSSAYYNAD